MTSYFVAYTHPGLGPRTSSRFGTSIGAGHYAGGLPASWEPKIKPSPLAPEIFRHCGIDDDLTNPEQAIGGKCFTCKVVLTREHAQAYQSNDGTSIDFTDRQTFKPGDRVELHPGCDLWMRGAKYARITSIKPDGTIFISLDREIVRGQLGRRYRMTADRLRKVE